MVRAESLPQRGAGRDLRSIDRHVRRRDGRGFSASIVDLSGKPGEVMPAGDNGLVFATGNNALALGEVQLEGKQRMSAREFARGHRWMAKL